MAETTIKKTNTEEEKKIIWHAYRNLLKVMDGKMKEGDLEIIRKAFELAVDAHSSQSRKSGEPYILHPIEVARICAEEIGLGTTSVVAAILHDVVEDTPTTIQDIEQGFGPKIAMIVDGLTKFKNQYDSKSPQAENFKKILRTLAKDIRIVLIKMADRLHNMRTIEAMKPNSQLKIASETQYIYAPLAHRLGLYNVKTEFQDLCMKVIEKDFYKEIAKKLQETQAARKEYIAKFIQPVTEQLGELDIDFRIIGRPKSISSIANKIKNKNTPFEEIYDLFAIRIILNPTNIRREKALCWEAYSLITDIYKAIPGRFKDWITTPKSNGYESLHTTVIGPENKFVEVQIRSERMNDIAERGYAAHYKYKGVNGNQLDVFKAWLDNVRDALENPEEDAVEFINDFKTNLFQEEVYVFTPKGDMIMLPKGATVLDFAFSIHSDVGYHCVSAKVNTKLVPLGYKLQNGDQVFITTRANQSPNERWLKMVVTGKARARIRSAMKDAKRKAGEIGKETLQRKLKNMKADFEKNADMLVEYFGFTNRIDLYYEISQENISLQELKKFEVENGKLYKPKLKLTDNTLEQLPSKFETDTTETKTKLFINDTPADQYEYHLATCCNPVSGDPVFAYITSQNTVKIHRSTCPNATHLFANYGYRIMTASWSNSNTGKFLAHLFINGIDAQGVAEKITGLISRELNLELRKVLLDGNDGYFIGRIAFVVNNKNHLNFVISKIKQIDGVHTVSRDN